MQSKGIGITRKWGITLIIIGIAWVGLCSAFGSFGWLTHKPGHMVPAELEFWVEMTLLYSLPGLVVACIGVITLVSTTRWLWPDANGRLYQARRIATVVGGGVLIAFLIGMLLWMF